MTIDKKRNSAPPFTRKPIPSALAAALALASPVAVGADVEKNLVARHSRQ